MNNPGNVIDIEEQGCNPSANPGFDWVLGGFLSRRSVLRGGVGSAAVQVAITFFNSR